MVAFSGPEWKSSVRAQQCTLRLLRTALRDDFAARYARARARGVDPVLSSRARGFRLAEFA